MKRTVLFCLALCAILAANAQELPYSKYLNFTKNEFKENRFKYDDYTNYKTVKNVDESYNAYQFIIYTDIEPSSEYLEKKAAKQEKRDAKGKKKKSVDELM